MWQENKLFVIFFFFCLQNAFSQEKINFGDLFSHNQSIELKTDVNCLFNSRYSNSPLIDAELVLPGQHNSISIEVRTRGNFRNNPDNCWFPPLILEFDQPYSETFNFQKIKIVVPCISKEHIEKELLIYKIYAELTCYSYQVYRAVLNISDFTNDSLRFSLPVFFIEPIALLSLRTNTEPVDNEMVNSEMIDTAAVKIFYFFQYIIGNNDWDISLGKNVDFVSSPSGIIPIPYDFDFASVMFDKNEKNPFLVHENPYQNRPKRSNMTELKDYSGVKLLFRSKKKSIRKIIMKSDISLKNKVFIYRYLLHGKTTFYKIADK